MSLSGSVSATKVCRSTLGLGCHIVEFSEAHTLGLGCHIVEVSEAHTLGLGCHIVEVS